MRVLCLLGLLFLPFGGAALAQDTRPLVEPTFPPVCASIEAPLKADAEGPMTGDSPQHEDEESERQARLIQKALNKCPRGQAVQLTLGRTSEHSAFLIDPIRLPGEVSLIVDGGVTVFASRNPQNYQIAHLLKKYVCGQVGKYWPVVSGCRPLITLGSGSGVYGYGVLDGQAQRPLIRDNAFAADTWWDLLVKKQEGCRKGTKDPNDLPQVNAENGCQQASPPMIHSTLGELVKNVTLYKITLRNPPFHTVMVQGTGVTVWGVKVQAPWNVPNSDGFDLNGSDILVKDVTVANGDQDIVLSSTTERTTSQVTVDGATIYSKGGVALLGLTGLGITDVLVKDVAMTGQVTSFERRPDREGVETVLINGQDPLKMPLRNSTRRLKSYGQTLPTATGEIQGVQLNFTLPSPGPTTFARIAFQSVCMQDVQRPIMIPTSPDAPTDRLPQRDLPTIKDIVFRDVHVLAPSKQFPAMENGRVQEGGGRGSYEVILQAYPKSQFYNHLTVDNVVFDDLKNGETPLQDLTAVGNVLSTLTNIYPPELNDLNLKKPPLPDWSQSKNRYEAKTQVSDAELAIPCPASRWPFLTGELYLSNPDRSEHDANLQAVEVPAGGKVQINAVLQPAMSQTTWFSPKAHGSKPGLLAIGTPALTESVEFYEGKSLVGTARLRANGTLATVTIRDVAPGQHTFTARYPGDAYYKPFVFGSVRLKAN